MEQNATVATSGTLADHAREVERGERFEFGKNWQRFLEVLNEDRIAQSVRALQALLGVEDLKGKTFLDVGSGSGLSSLAALRLGARVHSFDYDGSSVACTTEMRRRYAPGSPEWTVEHGSVLDPDYLRRLGSFDVVYSWGVLHHTGAMWRAIENIIPLVKPGGIFSIAIYNDQGAWSRRWTKIKRFYCSGPFGKAVVCGAYIPYIVTRELVADLVWMRNPLARYRNYSEGRGMSVTHDWFDWLGGYPFEVAKPEAIFAFCRSRGLELTNLITAGGSVGCNEFVFQRSARG
jgi:2-polyprenyl-6-hydroxyphenyl methylase/3-demethylubiquinone-9 3-methyltransferase